jgi:hypothetical protein
MPTYFLAIDFGPPGEFTAQAIVEYADDECEAHERIYSLRHLHRYPLGTPYTTIVPDVAKNVRPQIKDDPVTFVVDQASIGHALGDMLAHVVDDTITRVAISDGHDSTYTPDGTRLIPKMELVTCLQLLLQGRRLRVAQSLPFASLLVAELQNLRTKVVAVSDDPLVAWREGQHDDLVFAVALACHQAERCPPWSDDQPGCGALPAFMEGRTLSGGWKPVGLRCRFAISLASTSDPRANTRRLQYWNVRA